MTTLPTFELEKAYWKNDQYVLGIDEVGRGAFAGPLVLGGVIFSKNTSFAHSELLPEINDSKLLRPEKRAKLAKEIHSSALFSKIVSIPVQTINKYGIGKSTSIGVKLLCDMASKLHNYHLFMDGFHIPNLGHLANHQTAIVKGDRLSISIAAASIIAKVHRDAIMEKLHIKYDGYNFLENKGYGTLFHRQKLKEFGLSKIHRTNFSLNKYLLP